MQSTSVRPVVARKAREAVQLGSSSPHSLPLWRNVKLCSLSSSKEKHLSQLVNISMTGWTDFSNFGTARDLQDLWSLAHQWKANLWGNRQTRQERGGYKLEQEATSSPSGASGLTHWAICVWLQHFVRGRAQHVKIREMSRSASFSFLGCKLDY